jgi:hypothetical protein
MQKERRERKNEYRILHPISEGKGEGEKKG